MASSTWKSFEREVAKLFGGQRVPLSGRNSKHDTAADVMNISWFKELFVECKRDKKYLPFLKKIKYYDAINAFGICNFCFENRYFLYVYELTALFNDLFKYKKLFNISLIKRNCPTVKLFFRSVALAAVEGKSSTLICFRYHNRKGIFALSTRDTYSKLVRKIRERDGKAIVSTSAELSEEEGDVLYR